MLTLLGCQETLVTEDSCFFLMSLLTHLQRFIELTIENLRAMQLSVNDNKFPLILRKIIN